jgi:UDP-glucuronate 4-epimerase
VINSELGHQLRVLVTGDAGFIGSAVAERLLEIGASVLGLDNLNNYYSPHLKTKRLEKLSAYANFKHVELDLCDQRALSIEMRKFEPTHTVHMAAQAGVRYSIINPQAYVDSNVKGFVNIIEESKQANVQHFVYASSSSVYGANTTFPFSEAHRVDKPMSMYATTKIFNEQTAFTYSHLFDLPTTGLRLFTVYGPWGRPDMALFSFLESIKQSREIMVFNNGMHKRDFTYIDDVGGALLSILPCSPINRTALERKFFSPKVLPVPWRVVNIGSGRQIKLLDFISHLESATGIAAKLNFRPKQPGDVDETYADISLAREIFGYEPKVSIEQGIRNFVDWYSDFIESGKIQLEDKLPPATTF